MTVACITKYLVRANAVNDDVTCHGIGVKQQISMTSSVVERKSKFARDLLACRRRHVDKLIAKTDEGSGVNGWSMCRADETIHHISGRPLQSVNTLISDS